MRLDRQSRLNPASVFLVEDQVPLDVLLPALAHRSVRYDQFSRRFVINNRLPFGMLRCLPQIACPQEPAGFVAAFVRIQQNQERHVRVLFGVVQEHRFLALYIKFVQDDMRHRLSHRCVRSRMRSQPIVGKFHVLRMVRRYGHHLRPFIANLGHEMSIRRPRQRNVGAPHDQVSGVVPIGRLRHIGLFAPNLRRSRRQVGIPVVEAEHLAAQQGDKPCARSVTDHRHGRNRCKPGNPVWSIFLNGIK
ncbi:hypothetical protein D3C81_821250 [compost metagenome]